jgi:hypothetical protein
MNPVAPTYRFSTKAVRLFQGLTLPPSVLGAVCFLVLIGRWFDLFVMIFPSQQEETTIPGPMEGGEGCPCPGEYLMTLVVQAAETVDARSSRKAEMIG